VQIIEHHPRPEAGTEAGKARRRAVGVAIERWLQRPGTARLILVLSLIVTGLAWWATRHYAHDEARQRFERRTDDIHSRIDRRMASYEAMLRGGVALVAASPDPTREAWRRYVETVRPDLHYPGIQGFGVSRYIQPQELAAHEQAVRAEGFPDYRVKPSGPREAYSSIVFLEPFVARNLRAFGYDMMSEPTRREAMLRARDTGQAAISGIVTLMQENGLDVQKGFLLYLPVYRRGGQTADALWGWVYAPFRVRDLMQGLLGNDLGNIAFRIHDGSDQVADSEFYRSDEDQAEARREPAAVGDFVQKRSLSVAGRHWTVVYEGHDFEGMATHWPSHLVAVLGLMVNLSLYWSIASLSRRKSQVEKLVRARGAEVRARTAWLNAVTGLSPDGVLVFERGHDGLHRLVFTNPAFSQWFGLRPEDLLGLSEQAVDEWLQGLAPEGETIPSLTTGEARLTLAGPPRRVLKRGQREGDRHRVYYFHDVTHETEVDSLKNDFLSTAAHELRTPLASVYGFSELLQDESLEPMRRQRATAIVYRQASVLKNLVDELLDLARIDSRRGRDFQVQRCDLRRVADAAAESFLKPGEPSRVHVAVGSDPLWVDVDPAKMQQAIVNVLSNALKYSEPPAAVSLDLHTEHANGRMRVAVRVVDAGVGMTSEQCARAFDRFYRADPTGRILGAGLGLSIVKEVIELQMGTVELRSTPGAGTQVMLWLPLRGAPAVASPAVPVDAVEEPLTFA
jgi:signal transduction histidine kinase/CHASE1-domain containing sensor protein